MGAETSRASEAPTDAIVMIGRTRTRTVRQYNITYYGTYCAYSIRNPVVHS